HRFVPAAFGRRDVDRAILRVPREAFARDDVLDLREAAQRRLLAGLPLAFDELHDGDALAVARRAHGQAERRGGFALAGARVDDEQAARADRLARHFLSLLRLQGAHALAVIVVGRVHGSGI